VIKGIWLIHFYPLWHEGLLDDDVTTI